ncbi:MAG: serine hydrolase domain-containing protein [Kofleriaceae bacterium]
MTDLEHRLDSLLRKAVDRGRHVRHGLAGVAAADGSWSWMRGVGTLDPDGTTATAEARYPIASVTKLFTAVVTMKLDEAGKLRLDDRMAEVLPREVTASLHVMNGIDRTGEITVEHLLSHTSGLADYYEGAPKGETSSGPAACRGRRPDAIRRGAANCTGDEVALFLRSQAARLDAKPDMRTPTTSCSARSWRRSPTSLCTSSSTR